MGPRAHHDNSDWEIDENRVMSLQLRGEPELLATFHLHTTGLTVREADEVIEKQGLANRYRVTGIRSCTSPKDKGKPPGSFIILQSKDTAGLYDPAPPRIPEEPVHKPSFIDQLPQAETLAPAIMGNRLFEAFEGYDQYGQPSDQLSFLLRHYLVSPTEDGDPVYTLTSPDYEETIHSWKKSKPFIFSHGPATTATYTPDSPHITPSSLHYAHEIITLTHAHHFFTRWNDEHDMLFTREGGMIITPFSYIKGKRPIEPLALNLDDVLSDPLWNYSETMIQLWKLLPEDDTYQLQATLQTHKISLRDFFRVLGAQPSDFPS